MKIGLNRSTNPVSTDQELGSYGSLDTDGTPNAASTEYGEKTILSDITFSEEVSSLKKS